MILDKLLSKPARAKMIKIGLINIIQGKRGHCIVSSPNFGDYFICISDATAPTPLD